MSKLHKSGGVIKLTSTFSKVHAVPEWGTEAIPGGGSSADSSAGSDASSIGSDRVINRAEPCFLTQASCYTHQQAHVINSIRERSDKHVDNAAVVERFLERQGIVDPMFSLNAPCNLVNMDLALHLAMDKYAMIAVTCSEKFLDKYTDIITAENRIWASRHAEGKRYIRELQDLDESVRLAEFELVVLQPYHFLPGSSVLTFYDKQADGKVIGLKHYKMVNRVLREHPWNDTSPIFPTFRSTRPQLGHTVNPYLVILAAEIKFRQYLAANGPPLPPIYDSLMRKTIAVAELLYFQPVGFLPGFTAPIHVKVDMEGSHGPVGGAGNEPSGSTARLPPAGGGGTRDADANYWRHMLSGRDLELNYDDLDLLREIQASNRAASGRGQSVEEVEIWREITEV